MSITVASPAPSRAPGRVKSATAYSFSQLIIHVAVWAVVFLVPFFFYPSTLEPVDFNKQNVLVVFTLIALAGWLSKSINAGKFEFKKNVLNLPLLMFLGLYGMASFFSVSKYLSFVGANGQYAGSFITVASLIALYFVIINNFSSLKDIKRLLMVGAISAGLVGLWGMLNLLGMYLPIEATKSKAFNLVGSINGFGFFCAAMLTMAVTYVTAALSEKGVKDIKKIASIVGVSLLALLMLINVVMIDYWAIWVCLFISMVVVLGFTLSRASSIDTRVATMPMIVLVASVLFQFVNLPLNLGLPAEVTLNYGSTWTVAKGALQHDPLLGTGPGTFIVDYTAYKPAAINGTQFWNIRFDQGVAEFFSGLATVGMLGSVAWLLVMLTFVVVTALRFAKSKNDQNWLLGIGLYAGFISLLVAHFLYTMSLTSVFVMWVALALVTLFTSRPEDERTYTLETSPKLNLILSFVFILVVTFSVSGIYLVGQRYFAEVAYKKGIEASQAGLDEFNNISEKVSRAVDLNKFRDSFYRSLALLYSAQIDKELSKLTAIAADDMAGKDAASKNVQLLMQGAITTAKNATVYGSANVVNWDILAAVYAKVAPLITGADTEAIAAYEKAIVLEPKNPVLYADLSQVYVTRFDMIDRVLQGKDADKLPNKADLEKQAKDSLSTAEEKLLKAIEIKKDYGQAQYQLAMVYVRQKDNAKAIASLEAMRAASPRDVALGLQLAILYYQDKQEDKAIAELDRIIKLSPKYSNALWYLASIYEQKGEKTKAIELVQQVVDLNPDNQDVKDKLTQLKTGVAPTRTTTPTLPEPVTPEPTPGAETSVPTTPNP